MCIYSLSVPNNSGKRSLRAIGTPSLGAAPLFSASSRCPGSPNHIPIVASFSDSLGCLGWPLWCLRKGVSWSCMQHHLAQPPTPTKDQEDSHRRTLGCCFLVLISLRHACSPLLPGNPSKWESKKKVIINRARKLHFDWVSSSLPMQFLAPTKCWILGTVMLCSQLRCFPSEEDNWEGGRNVGHAAGPFQDP